MIDLVRDLIETIEKETGHYKKLIDLGEAQREILVMGKMEALNPNIRLQEKEVFALGPLKSKRAELVAKIGNGVGSRKMDLKQVVRTVPESAAEPLKSAVIRLVETVKKLDGVNQINEKLLSNAVSFASFTLRLIQGGGKKASFSPVVGKEAETKSYVNRVV